MKKIYEAYDEILFWSEVQKQNYLNKLESFKEIEERAKIELIDTYLNYSLKTLEIDMLGSRVIAYNFFNDNRTMDTMEIPSTDYKVLVIENIEECTVQYLEKVEQYVRNNSSEQLLLIDLNDISESLYLSLVGSASNITMYKGAIFLKVALEKAKGIIVNKDNQKIKTLLTLNKVKEESIDTL